MAETIIIGIGNSYRSDDGAGWAVIDQLQGKLHPSIILSKQRGDIVELLDAFANYQTVLIIDACLSANPSENWLRLDISEKPLEIESRQTSTHGLNISQAVALANNLNQLPPKLIIYAIPGENYQIGEELSPRVAKSIKEVTEAILKEKELLHA